MDEVICNDCGWTGDVSQLTCAPEYNFSDRVKFDRCPCCGSDDVEDFDEGEGEL